MFTIEKIKAAHAIVKSGADFPKYVQDIRILSVKSYDSFVSDGHTVYTSTTNEQVRSDAKYPAIVVADKSDIDEFKQKLKTHQQGGTDYLTFCNESAAAGVEKWVVNTYDMTCIYYDKAGNQMLIETIPTV